MSKKDEALKQALEALETLMLERGSIYENAIIAIREALADSALDRMAENARELGLDYEPPCKTGSQCTSKCPQCDEPAQDNTYGYAKNLAEAIFKQHFASDEHYASGRIVWGVNDTVIGILTQIDNMVSDMVRKPAQQQDYWQEEARRYAQNAEFWRGKYEEATAQQKEPVAWRWTESNGQHWFDWRTDWTHHDRAKAMGFAIEYAYTSPPQRKPLTDEEILDMARTFGAQPWPPGSCVAFARAIEAKLKENT